MKIPDSRIQDLLIKSKKITAREVAEFSELAKQSKKSLSDILIEKKITSEVELVQLYAQEIGIEYVGLHDVKIEKETLKLVPERIARKFSAIVFESDGNTHKLAMADPEDLEATGTLEKQLGKKIEIYISTEDEINFALDQYRGSLDSEITKVITTEAVEDEVVSEEEVAEDSPIAQTVNLVIDYAIKQNASDIHIEPRTNHVQVRYRIDGVLREANRLPRKIMAALVSRIKILANLKIDEHRAPQDGRFKVENAGTLISLRVSTLPVMDGEKVVMRLLDESSNALTLEDLGFRGKALEDMNTAMTEPHGIILVTGPTGSGKSTTLFSTLSKLNTPGVNISTVEDPVEYRLEGTNQTQVNEKAGMTFANGLRALLRQDPNIILVGEIRDGETASLAIQAALTGHLVFSTLHTNNAATSFPRLQDMGTEPFLIASTVRAIVGQRLVRKLCDECKQEYEPDSVELKALNNSFDINSALDIASKSDEKVTTNKLTLYRPGDNEACTECGGQAYKGRLGIYEVLKNDTEMSKLITSKATSEEIEKEAISKGMMSMHNDGLVKVLLGFTSIEEIMRVTSS